MLFDYYLQILCLPRCLGGYESKGRISFTNIATTSEPISLPLSILIMDPKKSTFYIVLFASNILKEILLHISYSKRREQGQEEGFPTVGDPCPKVYSKG